jgi:hypothetical protein
MVDNPAAGNVTPQLRSRERGPRSATTIAGHFRAFEFRPGQATGKRLKINEFH